MMPKEENRGWGLVRLNPDETLDEVFVTKPTSFHLEQMDNDFWWIGVGYGDGRTIHLHITAPHGLLVRVDEDNTSGKDWRSQETEAPSECPKKEFTQEDL